MIFLYKLSISGLSFALSLYSSIKSNNNVVALAGIFNLEMFSSDYFKVRKNGISPFETMAAYLGGSAFQTVVDNPVTAYRQLVQQYAKDLKGNVVDPKVARLEANAIFKKAPVSASLSGLGPRLIGVGFKRVPKFGFLLGISYFIGEGGEVGLYAATGASILSAPFINPIRMIEKQQRAYFKQTGGQKPIMEMTKKTNYNYSSQQWLI